MKPNLILVATAALLAFVAVSCVASELSWSARQSSPDALRQLVGLPSVAIGNLNPAARNPGLEIFCTSIYDSPGGYCSYYAPGVSFVNFTMPNNMTVSP